MENKSKFRRFLTMVGSVRLSQIWDKFKKLFNFCWKTGLAIFFFFFLIKLGEALIDTCKDHLGLTHYHWRDEDLGKNIEIRHFSNNQAATYNKITDERLSPKVRWILYCKRHNFVKFAVNTKSSTAVNTKISTPENTKLGT